nr:hypothetical protein [Brevibacillus laterosporus]
MDACVFDNNIVVALTNKPSKNRERLIWLGQLKNPMELSNQDDDETLKIIAVRRGAERRAQDCKDAGGVPEVKNTFPGIGFDVKCKIPQ